ncbi:MAG: hypothetical protein WA984_06970 [Phormidesmis sp.]
MAESTYSRQQIEQWQQNLEAIAQKPRTTFTKKQAVEALIDTIEKALETRSYSEVASSLKEWGLDISEGSLKQYVTRYRRAHQSSGAASTRRKRSTKAKKKAGATSGATKASGQTGPAGAKASAIKGTSKEKTGAGKKPGRFLAMDEDL